MRVAMRVSRSSRLGFRGLALAVMGAGVMSVGSGCSAASPGREFPAAARVVRDPANDTIRFLEGPSGLDGDPAYEAARDERRAVNVARAYLAHYRAAFRLDDPEVELFAPDLAKTDASGTHVRFQQVWRGLPVDGAEIIVHLDGDRRVTGVSGSYVPTPRLFDRKPALTADEARSIASRSGADCSRCRAELVVFAERDVDPRLAWRVAAPPLSITGAVLLIDADTGAVLRRVPVALPGAGRTLEGTER